MVIDDDEDDDNDDAHEEEKLVYINTIALMNMGYNHLTQIQRLYFTF